MEPSADDIDDIQVAMAWNLHYLAYTCVTLVTIWTYDYISSLQEEWTFLLRSRWTKVKALYIIARYVPFSLVAADLYMIFAPNKDADAVSVRRTCPLVNDADCVNSPEMLDVDEYLLITYALWNNNRIVLVAMLSALFAITVSFIGFWFATSDATTSTISGTVGCSWNMRIIYFSMPFLPSFVFALGLFFLALIRVIQSWRTARGPLGAILVKHNMFYYACTMNVLTPVLFSYVSANFLERFQVFILAILATRMHLHLWHDYWHAHNPDALTVRCNVLSV
ncbi:uncharacterized protein F5147DRAFT_839465 [Suillus discolor]|uniref:DUF6533 domain-containing protein n=1 Tax=Suillus discolor TaxID=1912936 RepID=A0A9P7EZB9_9AGAM|nr:uncharacterized protein F5147DRAFT_839465 [Suillus discolor]KAG2099288.1 hypothetical protein F5147DRAFT_839465 [Suillus discolor]